MFSRLAILCLLLGLFAPVVSASAEPASVDPVPSSLRCQSVPAGQGPSAVLPSGAIESSVRPDAVEPSIVHETAVGQAEVRPALQLARPVIVIEAPRHASFERLRRESYRYPDQDMGSRLIESENELPPLFGEDN